MHRLSDAVHDRVAYAISQLAAHTSPSRLEAAQIIQFSLSHPAMSSKIEILKQSEFGSRIAEEEIDDLQSYFVETESWRKVLSGDVDIVFGSKGAGKSALYSLLVAQKEHLRLGRRTVFIAAENPRGAPAFRDLTTAPPLSEEEFRGLWKLYFLNISATYLRHHLTTVSHQDADAKEVFDFLAANGLLIQTPR